MTTDWIDYKRIRQNILDRERLAKDVEAFLRNGGKINHVPLHATAWDEDNVKFMHKVLRKKS